jgi:hypothetical protein
MATTPTLWQRFVQDVKQRFLNFETVRGIYLLPVGVIGIYITITHLQFVIQVAAIGLFGYLVIDGLRKIFVNRIQQEVAKHGLLYDAEQSALSIKKDIAAIFDHSSDPVVTSPNGQPATVSEPAKTTVVTDSTSQSPAVTSQSTTSSTGTDSSSQAPASNAS